MRNMRQWLAGLIAGPKRYGLPIMTTPGIPLIGAAPLDVFRNGNLQYRAIKALADATPAAASLTMMDLSIEAEAFGAAIQFSESENPTVSAALVHNLDEIDRLAVPEVGAARTTECLEAARLCAEGIVDRPTLGGLIGPLSLAGRLLDMSQTMLLMAMEPPTIHRLLEKTTAFLVEYAKAFKATGCGGLIMAEPAAGLVSPQMSQTFSADYIRRVVEAVRDDSFIFVLHNCGKTERMVDVMRSTGASALHVGNAVDICTILEQAPADLPVMGNLDPVGVFRMSEPDAVYRATAELLDKTRAFPNLVISSGCDIPPGTPMANVNAFFKAIDDDNVRRT